MNHMDIHLKKKFNAWKSAGFQKRIRTTHLPSETLYEMAKSGGLHNAAEKDIAHLSLCPVCIDEWSFWSAVHGSEDEESEAEETVTMGWGMLKAAASPGRQEPLQLNSTCGRFRLNIFPDMYSADKAMVALEAVLQAESVEGKTATVKDSNSLDLLSGRFKHGRIACRHDSFSRFNLSRWTIVIEDKE